MGQDSKIEWTHHTFNPWRGCTKVAAGCTNCCADTFSKRNPASLGIWGPNGKRVVSAKKNWLDVLKWNRTPILECQACGFEVEGEAVEDGNFDQVSWTFDCPLCDGNKYRVVRPRVFCASMADVFEDWQGPMLNSKGGTLAIEEDGGDWRMMMPGGKFVKGAVKSVIRPATMNDFRAELFSLIDQTPNLDWLLVTKRPENVLSMWPNNTNERAAELWGKPGGRGAVRCRPNVWLLTSVATQADADQNIPELLKCRDLCPVLGVSAEPLIEQVDLRRYMWPTHWHWDGKYKSPDDAIAAGAYAERKPQALVAAGRIFLDWVIAGGESGNGARPCALEWIEDLRRQCHDADVSFFMKQAGAFSVTTNCNQYDLDDVVLEPWGDYAASARLKLQHPKGGDLNELPELFNVRQFPEVVR